MRRILMVLAAAAVMALMLTAGAAPAFANNGHPGDANEGIHSQGELHMGKNVHPVMRRIGHLFH